MGEGMENIFSWDLQKEKILEEWGVTPQTRQMVPKTESTPKK